MLSSRPAGAVVSASEHPSFTLGCGEVVLPGDDWLDGYGVDVFSNGDDAGSGTSCGGISYVHGVVSGEEWQCVELVDRLYLTEGWITKTWFGNGADMYNLAPGNLARQPQGSIPFLSPGDVISYQSPGGVEPGHAGIVNTVTPIGLGRFEVQLVQQNGNLFTSGILSNGVLTMTTAWVRNYPVIGVIHHPGARRRQRARRRTCSETPASRAMPPPAGRRRIPTAARSGRRRPRLWAARRRQHPQAEHDQGEWLGLPGRADEPGPGPELHLLGLGATNATIEERICVVLWGVGESTERGRTCTTVGATWTLVSAPYDVRADGLFKLRAQVYLLTPGPILQLTAASLVNDVLENASFEGRLTAGWTLKDPQAEPSARSPTGRRAFPREAVC